MKITGYGVYLPYWRLERATVEQALGIPAGIGTRTVASFDEDSTSMGVEAARLALTGTDERGFQLWFATTAPAYADKTNAVGIHAALGLDRDTGAYDVVGSVRSGVAALRAAAATSHAGQPAIAVLSDIRTGLPGSGDERGGGDAAAAFVFDPAAAPLVVELAAASVSEEFLDRWRVPGEVSSKIWEERFGETIYVPLAEQAVGAALGKAGLQPADITHLIVAGPYERVAKRVATRLKLERPAARDDLRQLIGVAGAAQPGVLLASVLDNAAPGDLICMLTLADGADCTLLRTTDALADARPIRTVADQIAAGRTDLSYQNFLRWRGLVQHEPPRRPAPARPAAPAALRNVDWKFGFTCSRCTACGTRHLPPQPMCLSCRAVDVMQPERLADTFGVITTYTVDHLAFSYGSPVISAIIDFDGGGRCACEITDVDPSEIAAGQRVEMTFRRLHTVDGVHDYFWKARPIRLPSSAGARPGAGQSEAALPGSTGPPS